MDSVYVDMLLFFASCEVIILVFETLRKRPSAPSLSSPRSVIERFSHPEHLQRSLVSSIFSVFSLPNFIQNINYTIAIAEAKMHQSLDLVGKL